MILSALCDLQTLITQIAEGHISAIVAIYRYLAS